MSIRNLAIALLSIAVLGTLYVLIKPQTVETEAAAAHGPPASSPASTSSSTASVPAARRIALSADAPGELAIVATVGERLQLEVQASRPGHLSLHGLSETEHAVGPPGPATITLDAAAPGVYPMHYHGPQGEHVPLGVLEIKPR